MVKLSINAGILPQTMQQKSPTDNMKPLPCKDDPKNPEYPWCGEPVPCLDGSFVHKTIAGNDSHFCMDCDQDLGISKLDETIDASESAEY